MWGCHDLWELGQAPVLRWLDLEDVERRTRDVARFDRVGQRVLVDEFAAGGVDDPQARLALRQTGSAEEVPRLGRRRKVEADVVGDLAHAVEGEQLDAERGRDGLGDERVVRDNIHAERAPARRDFLPDASEAAEAERLAPQLGAGQLLLVPDPALHGRVGGRHRAGQRQHQRQRVFSDAHAVAAGGVHDEDAAGAGRGQIDVVDPGSGAGNYPKFWRCSEQTFVDFSRAADDERVSVGQIRRQHVWRASGAGVDGPARYR